MSLQPIVSSQDIPTASKETYKTFDKLGRGSYDISCLTSQIDSFKKCQSLYENIQQNPFKAKVLSVLTAGFIVSLMIAGALGTHYAFTLISKAGALNGAVASGIIISTVVVTMIAGVYFNHKWHGSLGFGDGNFGFALIAPFVGIGTPLYRAFTNSLEKCLNEEFESIKKNYEALYPVALKLLNDQPQQTSEIQKAKEELEKINEFFSTNNPFAGHIELENLNS